MAVISIPQFYLVSLDWFIPMSLSIVWWSSFEISSCNRLRAKLIK